MKAFGLWVLLMVFGTALICISLPPPLPPGGYGEASMKHKCRKLKEDINVGGGSDIDLLDYHRIDPVPSSKAKIRPGPIQHGTPLIPYIPKTPPPGPNDQNHVDVVFP